MMLMLSVFSISATTLHFDTGQPDKNQNRSFSIKFTAPSGEFVYENSLNLSVSSPNISIEDWQAIPEPTEQVDKITKQIKKIFKGSFTIKGIVNQTSKDPDATIIIRYATNKMDAPEFKTFALDGQDKKNAKKHIYEKQSENRPSLNSPRLNSPRLNDDTTINRPSLKSESPITCDAPHQKKRTISNYVQKLIASTSSLWLQLLLALLLGLLMSLTPCIYPMIPITIGVLQAQGKKSLLYNFLLSSCYMLGIALMFATLGFTAAMTGSLFGKLLSNPIIVIALVLILLYFALSMFDFYEIKMPRFLAQRKQASPTGSLISAFVFGIVSGTIASPCLSPGLAFLLTIVASLGSKILGFALLFMFGVGMSIPLLIIGTFSSSMKFIPKTGLWMMEVKKLFGLLLIALCFYYLSNIMSITVVLWLIASFALIFGIYYILTALTEHKKFTKYFKLIIGTLAIGVTIYFYYKAIVRTWYPEKQQNLIAWRTNYDAAKQEAEQLKKLLFVDVGAPYCSICKAIDRCVLNEALIASLINQMIPVKIDAANSPEYEQLNKKFKIIGVPTILVVEPKREKTLTRWGAEMYSQTKQEIGEALSQLLKKK